MFVPGCHMMKRRDEWQVTQEILVSIRKKKKTKEEKTASLGPFHHYGKSVCVRACVRVFVSLRHMVIGLPSTHGMTKKAASSSSAQCRSVNKSEELVDVACASNNIFVNTAVG